LGFARGSFLGFSAADLGLKEEEEGVEVGSVEVLGFGLGLGAEKGQSRDQ